MISTSQKDIRPIDYKQRAEKVRKVKPKKLKPEEFQNFKKQSRSQLKTGIEAYTGPWEDRNVMHLLKRTLFGTTKEKFNEFKAMTFNQAVDALLTQPAAIDPPVNNYNGLDDLPDDPNVEFGQTWVEAPYNNDYEGWRIISLKSWILNNMMNEGTSMHQKMTFFWHNLLVTQFFGVFIAKASYQYYDMLYKNAFGNFKELIKKLTLDPAMLVYLNGTWNHKDAPDENYARELQELFCIGKGEGSGYTEADVQAAARVLTGHVIDWDTFEQQGVGESYFLPDWHDTSDKQFSSFYGNTVITGREQEGADELDDMLDMIFNANETSLYICRRLYNFFVYSEIDDQAEQDVIVPLAQIFRDNNYEILPVLDALFKSAHFNDPENHGVLIKNPLDFLIGTWKASEIEKPSESDIEQQLQYHSTQLWTMANMGLEIGDAPSVAGWPAYYQAPQFDKSWITTDTIVNRAAHTDAMAWWRVWITEDYQISFDMLGLVAKLDDPYDPNNMLQELSDLFLGIELSDTGFSTLKSILLDGQAEDYYWTDAWTAYVNNPGNEEFKAVAENRLKAAFQWLFQTGEFQLI
jgi:hypothetical protein